MRKINLIASRCVIGWSGKERHEIERHPRTP